MPEYVRPKVSGARVFFTLCLAARGSDLLVREIDCLRRAVAQTRVERPFGIKAWVVLPDHLHCVWQLPVGDGGFALRWGAIKARFSMGMRRARTRPRHNRWELRRRGHGAHEQ